MDRTAASAIVADGHRRLRPQSISRQTRIDELCRQLTRTAGWKRPFLRARILLEQVIGLIDQSGPPAALHFGPRP